jgi:hypothetical protein
MILVAAETRLTGIIETASGSKTGHLPDYIVFQSAFFAAKSGQNSPDGAVTRN